MQRNKKRRNEIIRFIISGTIVTAILYGVYLPLSYIIRVNIAYSVGFMVSFICNFFLSNYYTFRTKPTLYNALSFCGSHVINYLLQLSFLNLFIFLGVSKIYAPMPVWFVVFPINFLLIRFALKPEKIRFHKNKLKNK